MTVTYILLIPCCCWSFCDTVYRRGWAAKPTSSPMSTATHTYRYLVILQSTPQGCLVFLSTSGPVLVILCVRVERDGREVWIYVCWCSCFRQRGGLSLSWLSCSVLTTVYTNILNNTLIRQRGLPFPSASFHVYSQLSFPPRPASFMPPPLKWFIRLLHIVSSLVLAMDACETAATPYL